VRADEFPASLPGTRNAHRKRNEHFGRELSDSSRIRIGGLVAIEPGQVFRSQVVPCVLKIEVGYEQVIPLKGPQRRDKSAEIVATMSPTRKRADEPYG
jgi:hypothetical protein